MQTSISVLVSCLLALSLAGCGDDDAGAVAADAGGATAGTGAAGDDNVTDPTCNKPAPSDAFTADDIKATGAKVTCYYAPPLGYCVELIDPARVTSASTDGKGAIGCKDAIVRTDADCPKDTAIGKCEGISGFSKAETRYYYPCNQYDANPTLMSPEHSCMMLGGTYSAL
jgi:hypothetical protein